MSHRIGLIAITVFCAAGPLPNPEGLDGAVPIVIHQNVAGIRIMYVPEQGGAANCYAIVDPIAREAAVIDPGGRGGQIMADYLEIKGIRATYVLITHAHGDHISSLGHFLERTTAIIVTHPVELQLFPDRWRPASGLPGSPEAKRFLLRTDEQFVDFGRVRLKALLIPGHTLASLTYEWIDEGIVFTGDTLFRDSLGRTDLPVSASEVCLLAYIRAKLLVLDDRARVFPGHGAFTTIGRERIMNPFLRNNERLRHPGSQEAVDTGG